MASIYTMWMPLSPTRRLVLRTDVGLAGAERRAVSALSEHDSLVERARNAKNLLASERRKNGVLKERLRVCEGALDSTRDSVPYFPTGHSNRERQGAVLREFLKRWHPENRADLCALALRKGGNSGENLLHNIKDSPSFKFLEERTMNWRDEEIWEHLSHRTCSVLRDLSWPG